MAWYYLFMNCCVGITRQEDNRYLAYITVWQLSYYSANSTRYDSYVGCRECMSSKH